MDRRYGLGENMGRMHIVFTKPYADARERSGGALGFKQLVLERKQVKKLKFIRGECQRQRAKALR